MNASVIGVYWSIEACIGKLDFLKLDLHDTPQLPQEIRVKVPLQQHHADGRTRLATYARHPSSVTSGATSTLDACPDIIFKV